MGLVDLLQELIQVAFSMGPDGEDIVDVAPPNVWFSFCFSQDAALYNYSLPIKRLA